MLRSSGSWIRKNPDAQRLIIQSLTPSASCERSKRTCGGNTPSCSTFGPVRMVQASPVEDRTVFLALKGRPEDSPGQSEAAKAAQRRPGTVEQQTPQALKGRHNVGRRLCRPFRQRRERFRLTRSQRRRFPCATNFTPERQRYRSDNVPLTAVREACDCPVSASPQARG